MHNNITGRTSTCRPLSTLPAGRLVGCNSYSRLFRAKLGQHDVAVRVINHSGTSLDQVSNKHTYTCVIPFVL
jgi:hypothetical protein